MHNDLTRLPEVILVDLINRDNGTSLRVADVNFSIPEVNLSGKNTRITVTAKPNVGYTGSATLTYNRINLNTIPANRVIIFSATTETFIRDIISRINTKYLVNLTTNDFIDEPLPSFSLTVPGETLPFTLRAAPGSLIYNGFVELQLKRTDINLANIITNVSLSDLSIID